jgi:antirestriction protein ArdC
VGGDIAGYISSKDYITLPPAAAFKSMESYHATTLHELGHNADVWIMPRRMLGFPESGTFRRGCSA